jgi:SagB-type dehydrogenase family enzyme
MLCMVMVAAAQEVRPLPKPDKKAKMTLFQALDRRESVREYSDREIPERTLSNLLWAACGINRPGQGRITAPSAINAQDITVYVCRQDGAWKYDAAAHALTKVSDKDLRKQVAGFQDFAATAPVSLVLVSDISKVRNHSELGAMDAGYVSENICLACTALGLATVPRATMDKAELAKELKLGDSEVLMLNNPVGYKK